MSSDEEITMPTELVIIKRRSGGDEEGHHGGAWKIAYADFMTAMMAFFLVMWLVNSSDDKAINQIANYFNPIELNDRVRSTKGLNDIDATAADKVKSGEKSEDAIGKKGPTNKADSLKPPGEGAAALSEQELFADPESVLDGLARDARSDQQRWHDKSSGNGHDGPGGADAFRDPFSPALPPLIEPDEVSSRAPDPGTKKRQTEAPNGKAGSIAEPASAPRVKIVNQPAHLRLEAEIKHALRTLAPGSTPNIDVKPSDEGLLISITDQFDFGMFDIASAKPRPELVLVMEKLAGVLKTRREKLILRGHTDGRPFRSKTYDNWRLSTARAHMARHMLLRGGVGEVRMVRVEGHADRSLRIAANPKAAENRRIEILLMGVKR